MSEEVFFSTAQAVGKGLDYLSSEERAKALSKIPDADTRYRLAMMYSVGDYFPVLSDHANVLLLLFVSDEKALGRTGIQDVLKAQLSSERASMRDKLLGFIGRGEQG